MGKNVQTKFSVEKLKSASEIMRALAHPKRLTILTFIAENAPACVNDIFTSLRLEQSVTSQHLRILRQARLVETNRAGKYVYYQINAKLVETAGIASHLLADFEESPETEE
jgi:ArsR family transcriptional regulator